MEVIVAKRQGSDREVVAERSRRQTYDRRNTNWQRSRAWATSVLVNAKSKSIKTRQVEPGGTEGKLRTLPGEISSVRAGEKSAEVVVVKIPIQRWEEQKTEGANGSALRSIVSRGDPCPDVSSQ